MSRPRNIDEDEELEYDGPSSSKRFRPSNEVDLEERDEEDQDQEGRQNLLVGDDGFVEGSIVKITLTNFVTYDYCEIMPGPQMNMIIGPNGTGKSTIVCAIALGLGGTPALLGRAKNIAEFVKTGADEAIISIELKMVNTRNIVIQRSFKKVDNTNTWRKNGRVTSQRDIITTIRDLNIQVDNLCQFLPQDRVAEFAELSPSQLLERTQAAAGETELHEMQKQLMEWRQKEKDLEKAQGSDRDHLKTLQNRNAESERDVLRMQQRAEILNKIALLEAQIPLVKYSEAKATVDEIKQTVNTEKDLVQKVKNELEPTQLLIKEYENNAKKASKKFTDENFKYKKMEQTVKGIANEIQSQRDNIKATKASIASTKEKIPLEQRKLETIKAKIEALEEMIQDPPSTDYSQFEDAIAEVNSEISEIHNQSTTLKQKLREAGGKRHEEEGSLADKKKELREIENAMYMRASKIRTRYPDVYTAYEFIKNNPDKFTGRIHGPVVLSINVKDVRYASMVEQVLGGSGSSTLRYFICENAQDYRTFTRILIDEKRLKVNVTWPDVGNEVLKTPTTEEVLRTKFKMDHYTIDLLEGDSHVIRYLANASKINLIPLALKHSREEDIVNSGLFRKFCVGQTYYNVKVSDYGRRSKQTSTTPLRNAELLGEAVDREAKAALTEDYRRIEGNLQQMDVIIKEYNNEFEKIKRRLEECKNKKEDLQAQKRDAQRVAQDHTKKVHALQRARIELEESKKRPQAMLERIVELENKIEEIKADEEQLIQDYVTALRQYVECFEERNIYDLQKIYATEKHNAINTYCKEQMRVLQDAENNLMQAKRQLQLAQRRAQMYMKESEEAGSNLDEELLPQFREIVTKWKREGSTVTLESLEQTISEEKAKVDAIRFANPNAMKNYEDRKQQIEILEQKIEQNNLGIMNCKQEIATLRGVWEPRIDKLVSRISEKFSEAFRRIKCNGECSVYKEDDFDKWGIHIYVRFRDSEKLQLLTGQRQSGGERSVTTVLYLMALQNLAKSPFRVVDEINQGMDPRNERMIHEQIVLGASKPGTSQYFLITPKLLPNLFYNERMRVLCIYNSEWLPTKIQPLSYYLEQARANGVA